MPGQGPALAFSLLLALFGIRGTDSGWPRLNYSVIPDWPHLPTWRLNSPSRRLTRGGFGGHIRDYSPL